MNSINICEEISQNFIDSSYDVNNNRAFPDIRDGLKPGQRACLWEMFTKKFNSSKPHVKSAKISGGVAALWWPHGTTAIYETFARMSMPYINNVPEIDFHGSNGNQILGSDAIAADRYCVTGDTLIKTNIGTLPIKELQKYVIDNDDNLSNIYVYDYKYNKVKATKFFNSGKHPVKKIELVNGMSLKASLNHPILTVLSDGTFIWKRVEELKIKDKLLVVMPNIQYSKKDNKDGSLFAKAMGCLISEGYITTQNRQGINNTDIKLIEPVKDFFETIDSKVSANICYDKRGYYEYCVASSKIQNFLINECGYSKNAKNKTIPQKIMSGTINDKSLFLSYLFEGDGSVGEYNGTRRISYSTYSKELASQIQIMLAQDFGIFSSIYSCVRKNNNIEYKVIISNIGMIRFNERIGFVSERKNNILNNICLKNNKIANNSLLNWQIINQWIHSKIGYKNISFGNISNLYKCKDKLDEYNYSRIENLYKNYALIEIKSIIKCKDEEIFSVRVDNKNSEHSYIANGFINHNTEARLSKVVEDGMLQGIDKNNVDMILNFSEDEKWPKVLPSIFPRLLVNGAQGIGVSIANHWTLHNFNETANLILDYINSGELNSDEYYPDFPTGGTIVNKSDLAAINETGKGKIILEASYKINKNEINFYEMPYQVYIEPVIEQIKDAIEKEKIIGIQEVINKCDKKSLSLVVICNPNFATEKVLAEIFANTDLRKQYNVNQVGMVGKTPTLHNLKEVIDIYISHNTDCIVKEFIYDMNKAKERIHILEGLIVAFKYLDDVIDIIRNKNNAKEYIMNVYNLDEQQTKAILDMKLYKLSNLEEKKILDELQEKKDVVTYCEQVINDKVLQKDILAERLKTLADKYGDKRRTKIEQREIKKIAAKGKAAKQATIESVIVTVNSDGYIKSIPVKAYRKSKNDIFANKTDTLDFISLFSNKGLLYRLAVKNIKQCSSTDKGTALGAILPIDNDEKIIAANLSNAFTGEDYLFFATKNGIVKKTAVTEYEGTTQNLRGMKAINLKDGDIVVDIQYGKNCNDISLTTSLGYGISFESGDVSYQGKSAAGVKGINLRDKDTVIALSIGKAKYSIQKRGGKGSKIN